MIDKILEPLNAGSLVNVYNIPCTTSRQEFRNAGQCLEVNEEPSPSAERLAENRKA